MPQSHHEDATTDYYQLDNNQELIRKLFGSYFRSHATSGQILDGMPSFVLVKPGFLEDPALVNRASDKLILMDCVQRAHSRNGYVGVSKMRNQKLNYYWLELGVFPYLLGDELTQNNQNEFFYILSQFIEYTRQNPKVYGDMTSEIESDKDLALMLAEINLRGNNIQHLLEHYSIEKLLKFNPNWPVGEVNKLLKVLKGNELSWCEVFSEYILYVMGKQG